MRFSVNLSPRQFRQANLVGNILDLIASLKLPVLNGRALIGAHRLSGSPNWKNKRSGRVMQIMRS